MGVINGENTLKFRRSNELFDRVKTFLQSYDQQGIIDEGDFHYYVSYILEELGAAVYREHEALITVKDHVAKLPCNFKLWDSAYKCHPLLHNTKSINEQIPWIFYRDNEVTQECPRCCIDCVGEEQGRTKIVIRTFVNGDNDIFEYGRGESLILSPNVKRKSSPDCLKLIPTHRNEVTIDEDELLCNFTDDCIYIKYLGLPLDEDYLPMIPDNRDVEQAIEYYIYSKLFEQWYLNSTVADAAQKMQYTQGQYTFHMGQARYWSKLPSFQKMVAAIRRMRGNLDIYEMNDRTVSNRHRYFGSRYRR